MRSSCDQGELAHLFLALLREFDSDGTKTKVTDVSAVLNDDDGGCAQHFQVSPLGNSASIARLPLDDAAKRRCDLFHAELFSGNSHDEVVDGVVA